ncbi:MAG: hypothetical protein IJ104_04215 [Methanobrevibacter sp.]|nr:hypothetical protein [Methanobrevibacter sp.]
MASVKFINIAKSVFFKLEQYDFTKKFLIYSLITRKQNWKNKNLPKTLTGALPNYAHFYTPSLKDSKGVQLKNLFSKLDINISKDNFIFTIDEFKTVNYKYRIADNLSIDYSKVLNTSINELKEQFNDFDDYSLNQMSTLEAIEILIDRIVQKLNASGRTDRQELIDYFENIKTDKVKTFKEALQRILFFNQLLWQTGHNLNGFGRLDYVLDEIYNRDDITKDEALGLIKQFLKSAHSYYEYKSNSLIGDTGQIIVLGGLNGENDYFSNDLTYLFLKAVKDLNQPDPKLILRYSKETPKDLLSLAIETMATGVGSPLISNDEMVIPNLINFGYNAQDAYNYVVSACWEPAPVGKGLELNNVDSFVFIVPLNQLLDSEDLSQFSNFDEFLSSYKNYLIKYTNNLLDEINSQNWEMDPLLSLFIDDCNQNHLDFSEGGAIYNNYGLTSVSLSNTINSLYNVKKLVFDDKKYTLKELNDARKNNFNDEFILDDLKSQIKFGMDNDEILNLTNEVTEFVSEVFKSRNNKFGDKFKFGLSAPSYISKSNVDASLDGRKNAEPFNVHISLEENNDYTELMRFASKLDYSKHRFNGNVVDFMVSPDFIKKNFEKFTDFIKLSLDMGVFQMQLNVVDSKTLIDAQQNPDKFPNLIVRVWGFSTYFNDLPKDYQDVLIKRALEHEGKSN